MLIEHGADISAKDNDGCTPLYWAGNKCITRLLIAHGSDVSAKDRNGYTPLHHAQTSDIARVLLEHEVDVNARGYDGCTPMHVASRRGRPYVVRVLLEHGADIRAKDNDGRTPFEHWDPTQRSQFLGFVRDHSIVDFFYLFGLCDDEFKGFARAAILLLSGRVTADVLQRVVCNI